MIPTTGFATNKLSEWNFYKGARGLRPFFTVATHRKIERNAIRLNLNRGRAVPGSPKNPKGWKKRCAG
jgi:hypothetical protein